MNEKTAKSVLGRPLWVRITGWSVLAVFLFLVVLGIYWSRPPQAFWVNETPEDGTQVVGYSTTNTLIRVAESLLDKPGGYLTNDVMPPGVWLDNMPNWEHGVLTQVQDLARVIRNDYSRSQSQSAEDPDMVIAAEKFFSESNSWLFPPTERRYREGIEALYSYQDRLTGSAQPTAQFYARADNLREWLAEVEKRLGSMSRRLGNSVADDVINEELAGDPAADAAQPQPDTINVRTPWLEIDDVFFEARGTAWALLHFFRAVEFDFAQVLEDKNATASVRQIIRELEASLDPLRSPVILNGGGYGLTANHSLVMANYLARANAAVINLRELLDQG
ncbi:MAG: DUF2333 family protein [Woeseiaceae bacterium]|nr:DUF2333 family protein [Woeseiaceae bacterium]